MGLESLDYVVHRLGLVTVVAETGRFPKPVADFGTLPSFATLLWWLSEFDLFDQLDDSIAIPVAADSANRVDHVGVMQVVIAIDFKLGTVVVFSRHVAEDRNHLAAELVEVGPQLKFIQ